MTEALLLQFYLCIILTGCLPVEKWQVSYLLRKIVLINLRSGATRFAGVRQHVISLSKNTTKEACGPYRTTSSLIWFVSLLGPPPVLPITTAWSSDLQKKVTVCFLRIAVF